MKSLLASILVIVIFTGCNQPVNNHTIVQENTKDGVIDHSGYVIVKPSYKKIFNFDGDSNFFEHPHFVNLHWIHNQANSSYAIVQNIDGKYGIINEQGKLLLKPIFESITYFFNGFARIEVGGKFGLIDENFKIVLKPTYDYIQEFAEDIAIVHRNNRYGCINRNLELKIKPIYDRIYFQQEDFLRTELNGKWGYIDTNCDILSKPIYDYAYDFSNGLAQILLDEKVGYLTPKGNLITKPIYTKESASF